LPQETRISQTGRISLSQLRHFGAATPNFGEIEQIVARLNDYLLNRASGTAGDAGKLGRWPCQPFSSLNYLGLRALFSSKHAKIEITKEGFLPGIL
jgi:hypothetical protein